MPTTRTPSRPARPVLVAIRSTDEVRRRWRGGDLDAELTDDLADEDLVVLTVETRGGEVVGLVQLAEEHDPDDRHASLDVDVDPAAHRRGYASTAVRMLADHLFDVRGHHRLTTDPAADDTAAIACHASVGLRPVGVLRRYERQADGTWADGLLMDVLVEDRGERAGGGWAPRVTGPTRVPVRGQTLGPTRQECAGS